MPKKQQDGLFNKARVWWQTDTAKAVATIAAVLLVPAAVIAWNYASKDRQDLSQPADENQTEENSNQAGEESAAADEASNGEAQSEENAQKEQAGSAESENTAVGGINDVTSLPNTSSSISYMVEKGDNIYIISKKVCENNSFFIKNMKKNYIEAGQEIEVNCD